MENKAKKITRIISLILIIIIPLTLITFGVVCIWSEIEEALVDKIRNTIIIAFIVLIVSYLVNSSIEET